MLRGDALGHRGHGVVLVVHGDVEEAILHVGVHALDAVLDDDGELEDVGGVVGDAGGDGGREDVGVAVLVLEAFAEHGGASGGAAHEEALAAGVGEGPGHIADALEAEHGVVHVEGDGGDAVVGVGSSGGGEGGHGAGFGDALFEDLAVFFLGVAEEHLGVVGSVLLAFGGVDADGLHDGLEAEGAALVGDDGDDELADGGALEQAVEHIDKAHGGGDGAVFGAVEPILERVEGWSGEVDGRDFTRGHRTAKMVAAGEHVLDFGGVQGGAVGDAVFGSLVGDGDVEALDEGGEGVVGELLFRVGSVAGLRGAEAVALDGLGEDDGGAALVLDGLFVGVVDLFGVVAAAMEEAKLLVGLVRDEGEEFGVFAEEVLAEVLAVLGLEGLEVAVDALFHTLEEEAPGVFGEELVPVGAPDDLDDVPSGSAKCSFELVDDAFVAADGAVEALEVAVDDEDEVVELFAGAEGDGTQGVDLVGLAVADEGPDLAVGFFDEASVFEVLHEAGLVDGVEWADAHGDGREAPEVGHEPGVRVAGQAGLVAEFVAEVLEVVVVEAAFEVGAGVDAGGGVALEVDEVSGLGAIAGMEEVVEAYFEEGGE